MNYFLNKSADYIFKRHKISQLADITIVLPTRRGTISFKKSLAKLSTKPFISPKIVAVEDFIFQTTNLTLLEPIDLVFELFSAMKLVDEKVKFDLFMSWAPTLLKDFETIDQYLVDAKQLFEFMTEAKAIERWNVTEIKSKNPNFETSVDKYFELFKKLYVVYETFNSALKSNSKAYRGSAYRFLAENAEQFLLNKASSKYFYFLGFNALSISEEKIIKVLIDAQKAEMLWDSDDYYMKNVQGQIAGKFLREIKKSGRFGANWNWQENELLISKKNIKIIGLPNISLQPVVAASFLDNWAKAETQNQSTVLILADETLLPTVLSQIPNSIKNYNITMGLSVKDSPLFSLIENIFELHRFQKNEYLQNETIKFNTRLIIKLLNHVYVKKLFEMNNLVLSSSIKEIFDGNQLYLSENIIERHLNFKQFSDLIFKNWDSSPAVAIVQMHQLLTLIYTIFDESNGLEINYLSYYFKILNRVDALVKNNSKTISISGLKSILFQIIKQTKLPFESNSSDGLQIMGMLETRTLDFERIIILSANEGNLPTGKKSQSLIPFDALTANNMPTYGHQDAIMAYHFFRLLQRAKEVVLIYTIPNASNGNKEKTRFILQIEHELAKLNNKITIEYPEIVLENGKNEKLSSDFQIEKTDVIIEKIKNSLTEKGLFATTINEYIRCEMLYYFNRVAKIEEPDEIDEYIGNDIFGLWVHKTLENIDLENLKKGGNITKDDLIEIRSSLRKRLETDFAQNYSKLDLERGMNLILLNVAEKVLYGYLTHEIEFSEFPQTIVAVEKTLLAQTSINVNEQILNIRVGGKIDKIDKISNKIRIIDYKTGKVEHNTITFGKKATIDENIENMLTRPDWDKMRQLWLYKYIFLKAQINDNLTLNIKNVSENSEILTGIYSFRNNKEGFMEGQKYFSHEQETVQEFIDISEDILARFLGKLLDKNRHFSMTTVLKSCEYCAYKGICNR